MGILVQKSCYTAPTSKDYPKDGTKDKTASDERPIRSSSAGTYPDEKFIQLREQELTNVLDLVQAVSFAIALDANCFPEDNELRKTLNAAIDTFFPPTFDKGRVSRAFRKVAQNILLRGIRNLPHSAPNPSVSDEQLTFYVQDKRISRSGQAILIRSFPRLRPDQGSGF